MSSEKSNTILSKIFFIKIVDFWVRIFHSNVVQQEILIYVWCDFVCFAEDFKYVAYKMSYLENIMHPVKHMHIYQICSHFQSNLAIGKALSFFISNASLPKLFFNVIQKRVILPQLPFRQLSKRCTIYVWKTH